ncbi:MAG: redoxin domain-containing protein [Myxococcales bacterium FL481]|nr:MAG: redoxin domain-containing protein [Myxococcales bacterium FL481]
MDVVPDPDAKLVYLAAYAGGLAIDVEDPTNMRLTTSGTPPGRRMYWAAQSDEDLVITGRESGLIHLELTGAGGWTQQGTYDPDGFNPEGLAWIGEALYVAAQDQGVVVLDGSLAVMGSVPGSSNAMDIVVTDTIAYVLDRDHGLMVVDVSDAFDPQPIAELDIGEGAQSLAINDKGVVVVAAGGRVIVIDASTPEAPEIVADLESGGTAFRVDVAGDIAAVANWQDTRIYDISLPECTYLIGLEDATDVSTSVALQDDILYVGDWDVFRAYQLDAGGASPEYTAVDYLTLNGQDEVETTLVVRNDGAMELDVTEIRCDDERIQIAPTSFTLAPEEIELVRLSASLSSTNPWSSDCTIASNDEDESEASLYLDVNPTGVAVGDIAPDWSVPDLDGNIHNLSDYAGKIVVLTLFSSL